MSKRRNRKLTALVVLCSFLFHISPLPALASARPRRHDQPTPAARDEIVRVASNIQQNVQHRADIAAPVDMAIVTAPTEIVGTATGPWTLSYAPVPQR
ncbi:MAG: hypothetical protein IJR14_02400, partial [Synergistaceae bacterium]|nr:hypothetical protein [Synergistaceae bacterium]